MGIVLDRLVYELYRMPNDLILSKPNFGLSIKKDALAYVYYTHK